ncbi:MAG: DUF1289 domain-containing protein [Myxococcota bacterium]
MKSKVPSPCIDVCKYKRQGHCIGCAMTKAQKSLFKTLKKDKHRAAFVQMLGKQQDALGKYKAWSAAYAKKCAKQGVKSPTQVS